MSEYELYHHGILGMKWGVRRYQNKDGSYTRKGLQRYNKAKQDYDIAKEKKRLIKKGAVKGDIGIVNNEIKTAKRQLDKSYNQLSKDYKADQGKTLYQKGKTITDNTKMVYLTEAVIVAGANVTSSLLSKYGSTKIANIAAPAIAVGGTLVNAMLSVKTNSENKKLRAYYSHSRL